MEQLTGGVTYKDALMNPDYTYVKTVNKIRFINDVNFMATNAAILEPLKRIAVTAYMEYMEYTKKQTPDQTDDLQTRIKNLKDKQCNNDSDAELWALDTIDNTITSNEISIHNWQSLNFSGLTDEITYFRLLAYLYAKYHIKERRIPHDIMQKLMNPDATSLQEGGRRAKPRRKASPKKSPRRKAPSSPKKSPKKSPRRNAPSSPKKRPTKK